MSRTIVRRGLVAAGAAVLTATLVPLATSGATSTANPNGNAYRPYVVTLANGTSGEPSLVYSSSAKAAFYGAATSISRLTWNDALPGSPLTAVDVTPVQGTATTLDTIVATDPGSGRVFFLELAAAGSVIAYTDDGGKTFNPSSGVAPGALLDHESLGAGPFAPSSVPHPVSNFATYYCAQNSFNGACGVSNDGGITFSNGIPAYNTPANDIGDPNTTFAAEGGACAALHGHLKVGPDGTAYLPIKGCGGVPTVANLTNTEYAGGVPSMSVSTDNGVSWSVRMNPNGHNTDESDNSVAVGPKNTVYMTWEDGVNPSDSVSAPTTAAKVSISTDHGTTWLRTANLNPPGINNVMFPVVITGDDNRAAVAFLGTSGIGDDQQNGFAGAWDLFMATTYDGGLNWNVVDATAGHPVHRGCIDNQGLAPGSPKNNVCTNRKMLDFNDIAVDATGRPLVAYTQTCTSAACQAYQGTDGAMQTKLSSSVQNMVLRQSAGKGLYAAGDPTTTPVPTGGGSTPAPTGSTAGSNAATAGTGLANTAAPAGAAGIASLAAIGGLLATSRRRRRRI